MPQHSLVPAPRAPDLPKPLGLTAIGQDGSPSRSDRRVGSPYFLTFKIFDAMKKGLLFLFFALLCGATATQAQTTRYVAPTAAGNGSGSSWANASGNLQTTINASASGDAVWVKAGTYLPTANPTGCTDCTSLRDKTFYIKDGVKLYGGFAGTETALSQRLIATNVTTLSGDIGTPGDASDNASHVVLAAGTTGVTVDGFTITGGNATEGGSSSVNGITTYKYYGGGIYIDGGTNTITNNTLSGNSTTNRGGGIYTNLSTNTLTNNTLSGNSAILGGGIYTNYGTNILSNNTFSGNSATYDGGGIYTVYGTNTITNNTLSGNSATSRGGGIYTNNGTNTITNNTLSGNSATNSGGGIYTAQGTNTITNNTLSGNSATNSGGGIFTEYGTVNFKNNIFWGNLQGGSSTVAGADYFNFFTTITFTNNLMQLPVGTYTGANYSLGTSPTGNIFATDPLFVDAADIDGADNLHRTADDGLRLQVGSPVINTGTTTGAPATDILGTARPQGTGIDMGAYEWFFPCPSVVTLYVDAGIGTSGNGQSWTTAYKTLDEALAVAHCCSIIDTIKVAQGTYIPTKKPYNGCTEMTTTDTRDLTFHLPDGIVLWGGYPTSGGVRNSATNVTTLSGDIGNPSDATDNAYHVVLASAATSGGVGVTIDGFTITGGNAYDASYSSITVNGNAIGRYNGGGIYTQNGTNILSNNTLSGNSASQGGGIYSENGTNTLTNNTLSGNSSSVGSGGGIYTYNGTNTLTNNTLSGNSASDGIGGGIYTYNSTNTITNNTLSGNSSSVGGGIYSENGTNTLTNNTLSGNSAAYYGGGFYTRNGTNTLTNNTFSGNTATVGGGGIYTIDSGTPATVNFKNNIFWGNQQGGSSTIAGADYINVGATVTFTNNLMQLAAGDYTAVNNNNLGTASGNIFATDPLFVDAADIDGADNLHRTTDDGLRLQAGSPAINTGDNTGVAATDITGAARIQNTTVDMGAYEWFNPLCIGLPTTLYVDGNIGTSGNGQSWATAYQTLDEALAVAHCCSVIDTIKVAQGTYIPTKKPYNGCTEMTTTDTRDLTFHLPDGIILWGGYPTGGGVRNSAVNISTLSGDIGTPSDATDNAYHVVLASAASSGGVGVTMDGFTITGGNGNVTSTITVNGNAISTYSGGGISTRYGTNTISNNTINGNFAGNGGGIYVSNGNNTISNNTINGNFAAQGAGLYLNGGTGSLNNNSILNNAASNSSGGINISASYTISNNTISGNSATDNGGGIGSGYSASNYYNNTFSGNTATNGGAMNIFLGNQTFRNNTFSGNTAANGGALYISWDMLDQSINNIKNCIFWGNLQGGSANVAGADIYNNGGTNTVTYSITQENSTYSSGTGIINNQDPLFVDAADIDGADNLHRTADDGLRLQAGSPAINTGTTTGAPATDILGTTRPQGTGIDMGAYEWFYVCPSVVTLYVDGNIGTSGNGQSWATAYQTVDEALAVAHCCSIIDTIKVAQGTYIPTKKPYDGCTEMTTTDDRDKTFHLPDGIVLWGGYPTGGGVRNSAANNTILSGDIGTPSDASDNAYHVVVASAATSGGVGVTVDGFTITGGNANDANYGDITVNGNTISRYGGGGISTASGTNTLTNNTLSGNSATTFGGGIFTQDGTNTLTNNTLSENSATYYGGGIFTQDGTNTIANNTFSGNSASEGGGIYTYNGTNTLTNNTLSGNTATNGYGGGIYANNSTNTMSNNTLSGNSATTFGGGIYISSGTNTLTNNTFSGNTTPGYGGGIFTESGTNTLTNNTFSGNSATTFGGGILTSGGTSILTNNIFWGNKKGTDATVASADYYNNGATVTFTNNLMQLPVGTYTGANYSLGTSPTGNIFATDPLFVDAADIDGADNIHRTADDGLRLQATSPAINVGDNTGVAATDITGAARIQNTTVDMGAYEWFFPCPSVVTLYVDGNIGTSGNGQSWATAYQTLDEALAVAHCCSVIDTIKVAQGTYIPTKKPYDGCTEMTTTETRDLTFHLPDGIVLWGGYPTGGGVRNSAANSTILSGDIGTPSDVTDNAYHVVLASAATSGGVGITIDGFTITGGNADASYFSISLTVNGNAANRQYGGGIYILNGTNTITNNTFSDNKANQSGGGIYTEYGTNTMSNNTLSGNTSTTTGGGIVTYFGNNTISNNTLSGNSTYNGGGIATHNSTNTITNNTISGNTVENGGGIYANNSTNTITNNTISGNTTSFFGNKGGGIFTIDGTNTITNNTISGNMAHYAGGGIYAENGTNTITNNTISRNTVNDSGGGICTNYGTNTITNNTIVGNTAVGSGGGGISTFDGTSVLTNNIFWGNKKGTDATVVNADYSGYLATVTFTNNLMQLAPGDYTTGNYNDLGTQSGNIFATDPLFVNAADIDGADNIHRTADDGLQLKPCSPVINMGDNTGVAATDITGAARIQLGTVDMGAYEAISNTCVISTANPACGSNPSVTSTGSNQWLHLEDAAGNRIASILDSEAMGTIEASYYINTGALRVDWAGVEYVDRNIAITVQTQPAAPVLVRYYFLTTEFNTFMAGNDGDGNDVNAISGLVVTHIPGATCAAVSGANSTLITPTANGSFGNGSYVEFSTPSFSGFFLHGGAAALPVELLNFTGRTESSNNRLLWATATEHNTAYFVVERSANGTDFAPIGDKVLAAGNSTTNKYYELIDEKPLTKAYYRLRMVDVDGAFSYSASVLLQRKGGVGTVSIAPNPATQNAIVTYEMEAAGTVTFNLIDALGRIVQTQTTQGVAGTNLETIHLEALPSAVYSLQVLQNNSVSQVVKLTVVK